MKKLILISAFILSTYAQAQNLRDETIRSVLSALQCEKNESHILGVFSKLESKKAELQKVGITFSKEGEEMDEVITLKFAKPMEFHGAQASSAQMSLGGDFNVSADFTGKSEPLIKALGLTKSDSENKEDYIQFKGKKNDCPPTKRLRSNGTNSFKFGCGWCNG